MLHDSILDTLNHFNSTLQGIVATAAAFPKSKVISSNFLDVSKKLEYDTRAGKVHVYISMSRNMFLYQPHLWCHKPSNIDKLESAYLILYKNFFFSFLETLNYVVRI